MKVFKFSADGADQKCYGCGWRVFNLYTLADSQEEADKHHEEEIDLCGDCLCEVMADSGHEVTSPPMKGLQPVNHADFYPIHLRNQTMEGK